MKKDAINNQTENEDKLYSIDEVVEVLKNYWNPEDKKFNKGKKEELNADGKTNIAAE